MYVALTIVNSKLVERMPRTIFFCQVSTACEGLCKWVRAIEVYDR